MNRLRGLLLVLATLASAREVSASPATPPGTAREASAAPATPPSTARGERLDGRESHPGDVSLKTVPRVLLFVPRVIVKAIMLPTAWAGEQVERHHLYRRLYWAVTSDDRLVGLRPEFVFESSDYFMAGLRYFNRRMLGENSQFRVRARAGGARSMFGDITIDVRGIAWSLEGERRDNATFAGTEGQTKEELEAEGFDVTRFGYDRAASKLAIGRHLGPVLSLQSSVEVGLWDFNNGKPSGGDPTINEVFCVDCAAGQVDEALVPGFNEGVRRVQAGAGIVLDTRADARFSSGVAALFAADWAHGIAGDPSHDMGGSADVQGTLDLTDRAVGVRLRAALVEPLGDDPVPFINLAQASGRYGIRGLRTGRLRGNTAFVGSVFYRYLLTPNIDLMLFADYGGAFGSWFDGFTADHLIDSYGASLWLYNTKGRYFQGAYLARIEAAWAPGEGARIVLVTHLN
jgi:hypothetical protein